MNYKSDAFGHRFFAFYESYVKNADWNIFFMKRLEAAMGRGGARGLALA